MKYPPRPYQTKSVEDMVKFVKHSMKKYGVFVLPTGAGKSICIAMLAKELGDKILILQPNKELVMQNYEKYTSYGLGASIYSASLRSAEIGDVTFATIGSIVSSPDLFKHYGFKYMIIDECHWATKKDAQTHRFIEYIGVKKVIGLTATPINLISTMNGTQLKMINRMRANFFQDIFHVTQIGELAKDNFWSKLDYRPIDMNTKMLNLNSSGTDYTERSMIEYYEQNNLHEYIIRSIDRLRMRGRKHILVFVPMVEHARKLAQDVKGSEYVHGGTSIKDRNRIVNGFRDGAFDVVFNVNVLGTGFDFPAMDAGIHARPTNSVNIWYQHIGRFVRRCEGKEDALIVDISGNYQKFGPIENFTFENDPYYGWVMYSGDKVLTGVDLKSKMFFYRKKEEDKAEYAGYKMPFGKHAGLELDKVPMDYLHYVVNTFSGRTPTVLELKRKCKSALAHRQTR